MSISTHKRLKLQSGFTLIELLVVIGILAILLAITLIAINPNKHFQDSRNTQRSSNVSEILNAIYEYESANNGNRPASVTNVTTTMPLGKSTQLTATSVTFASSTVTFTVSGNTIPVGANVLVTGCSDAANNGTFPVTASSATSLDVTNASGVAGSTGCKIDSAIDVCSDLAPTYIADLPTDPTTGTVTGGSTPCAAGTTAYDTGYTITQASGRFTIAAPSAEGGANISVTR
jgi:prepilin-type N-terminal cleavage/methylation domain-containing protein